MWSLSVSMRSCACIMRFSWPNRSVPAAVENCAFQRASGVEEQGRGEVFRQVLSCGGEQPVGRFDDGGVGYGIIAFSCAMTASK